MVAAALGQAGKITPYVEAALFLSFAGILILGALWIVLYKALGRRLAAKRPASAERRNAMDHFFSKLLFVFGGGDREIADAAIARLCLGLRACAGLLLLCFLVMVFGPFLLGK